MILEISCLEIISATINQENLGLEDGEGELGWEAQKVFELCSKREMLSKMHCQFCLQGRQMYAKSS